MEDEYLSLTEKGEKVLELTFKAAIEEWSKKKLDEKIKKVMEDIKKRMNVETDAWNKIIGKDKDSVIK